MTESFGQFVDDEEAPFKKVTRLGGGNFHLREISSPMASFVGREMSVKEAARALGVNAEDPVFVAKRAKQVLGDLKEKYNIPVAVQVVLSEKTDSINKNERKPVIHLLADKIKGHVLWPADKPVGGYRKWIDNMPDVERKKMITELDDLIASLANYVSVHGRRNDFMADIGSTRQYMWGRKEKKDGQVEAEPHIYLIDVELLTSGPFGDRINDYISVFIGNLKASMTLNENAMDAIFPKAREAIQKLESMGRA